MGWMKTLAVAVAVLAVSVPVAMYSVAEMRFARSTRGMLPFLTQPSTHGYSFNAIPDLTGKTAVVTGANVGLGFYTAKHLAINGADTVLACRSLSKCAAAVRAIQELPEVAHPERVTSADLDLSSLQAVRAFAEVVQQQHGSLDMLIMNAGVMHPPHTLSADGIELQWAVNHVAHQLLATLLLPMMASPSTIVSVSSNGHFHTTPVEWMLDVEALSDPANYNKFKHYGSSKLANVLFAAELADRLGPASEVFVNSLNPGGVSTELGRHHFPKGTPELLRKFGRWVQDTFAWDAETAALTQLYAATSPEIVERRITGQYFVPIARICEPSDTAQNRTFARMLWKSTEALIDQKLER